MRIAYFSDNFYPETSGISDSILALAKELTLRGHFIDFYVPHYSKKEYVRGHLPHKELDLGSQIKIHRLWSIPYPWGPSGQARIVIPTGFHIFKLRRNQPDVIHSQLFFGVGLEALICAKILKVPLIGTNHTNIKSFIPSTPLIGDFLKKIFLHFASWYYNRCDYVTAPADFLLEEMRQYGFSRPHKMLSNPIDVSMFTPSLDKEKSKRNSGYSDNVLFFAGRLAPEKNIDVVIRALAAVRQKGIDAELVLAGAGVSEFALKKLGRELGVEKNMRFLGNLDKAPLSKVYQASDVFILASKSETQSLTLMQAMATAVPSVVVNAGALPQYVKEGENGFIVATDDHDAMAERIILLLKNPELRKKIGENSRQYVSNFRASVIALEWENLYNSVLKKG